MPVITEKDVLAALATVNGPDGRPVTQSGVVSGVTVHAGKVYVSVSADPARPQAAEPVRQAVEAAVKAMPGVAGRHRHADGRACARLFPLLPRRRRARSARAVGHRQGRRARREAHHRGRLGQGRRRQVDDGGEPRARARGPGPQGRHPRRRHLRPFDAQALRPAREAGDPRGARHEAPLRLRPQGHVHRLPRRGGHGNDLARADGDVGHPADAARGGVGRTRRACRRHAAGHWRRAADDVAGRAACRRRHRLDAAGPRPHRRPTRHRHVQARRGAGAGHCREHVDVHLPALRREVRHLRHGGARQEAQRLGVPFLGEVPLAMRIREKSDAGLPVVATEPDGPHAAVYKDIARQVWATVSGKTTRAAPRIVIE